MSSTTRRGSALPASAAGVCRHRSGIRCFQQVLPMGFAAAELWLWFLSSRTVSTCPCLLVVCFYCIQQHSCCVSCIHAALLLHHIGPLHITLHQTMSGQAHLARLLLMCAASAACHCCCCCCCGVCCGCRMEPDEMAQVLQQVPVKLSIVEKTEGCWEVCMGRKVHYTGIA